MDLTTAHSQVPHARTYSPISVSPLFSDVHEAFRLQIRKFVDEKVKSRGDEWEVSGYVDRDTLAEMGAHGFLGIRFESQYGGSELDALATVVLAEELGRSTFGGFSITVLAHTDMAAVHVSGSGSDYLKSMYMSDIVAGRKIMAIAVTEADAGSDVKGLRTTAVRTGDEYVLNGSKTYITNGVFGDLVCVAARTVSENISPKEPPSKSISMFLIERGNPGLRVGRVLQKHGWRSSDTAELFFENCRVPASHLLGCEGQGFKSLMRNFQNERLVLGAMAVGESQTAIDLTLDWVRLRKAFGASLWQNQTIRHKLAMLQAQVEAARQLVYHAAWIDNVGADATKQVAMVKALCGELVNDVLYTCLQFHGGAGCMSGAVIERMARDARIHSIGGGATEVMLEEVAKRM